MRGVFSFFSRPRRSAPTRSWETTEDLWIQRAKERYTRNTDAEVADLERVVWAIYTLGAWVPFEPGEVTPLTDEPGQVITLSGWSRSYIGPPTEYEAELERYERMQHHVRFVEVP